MVTFLNLQYSYSAGRFEVKCLLIKKCLIRLIELLIINLIEIRFSFMNDLIVEVTYRQRQQNREKNFILSHIYTSESFKNN